MKLLFWLRSLIATAYVILATATTAALIILTVFLFRTQKIGNWLLNIWASSSNFLFNIHLKVSGLENLPEGGCLFLINHSSDFDIIAFHHAVKKPARFGAKTELFKIPIFGQAMRAAGALEIFRAERSRVLELYEKSIARVHAGESFVLAAEGTRQPVPGVGKRFKSGPFIFAISGQFPIVPVVIRGAAECLPKGRLVGCTDKWRHDVHVMILPPVSTKGLTPDDREGFQTQVQNLMTTAYNNG